MHAVAQQTLADKTRAHLVLSPNPVPVETRSFILDDMTVPQRSGRAFSWRLSARQPPGFYAEPPTREND
jgi:hypothetical protein